MESMVGCHSRQALHFGHHKTAMCAIERRHAHHKQRLVLKPRGSPKPEEPLMIGMPRYSHPKLDAKGAVSAVVQPS